MLHRDSGRVAPTLTRPSGAPAKARYVRSAVVGGRPVAFVTGGPGFVGGALIRVLVDSKVRAQARSAGAMAAVGDLGAVPIKGDVTDRASLERGMAGGKRRLPHRRHVQAAGPRKEFDRVNVGGMQAVVDAAAAAHRPFARSSR